MQHGLSSYWLGLAPGSEGRILPLQVSHACFASVCGSQDLPALSIFCTPYDYQSSTLAFDGLSCLPFIVVAGLITPLYCSGGLSFQERLWCVALRDLPQVSLLK